MDELERLEEMLEEMNDGELIKNLSADLTRYQLAYAKLAELTGASAELLMKIKAKYKLE